MPGKKAGTPNYNIDLIIKIVGEKLPQPNCLAEWNAVAVAYHLRSGEKEPRTGKTIENYFINFLCRKKRNPGALNVLRQIVGPEAAYASSESDENGDESDDEDCDYSFPVGGGGGGGGDKAEKNADDQDNNDDEDDDDSFSIGGEDITSVDNNEKEEPTTDELLRKLVNITSKLNNRVGQAANMQQILAMFSLQNQTQTQNQENLIRVMEQRWQLQHQNQEEKLRGIQKRMTKFERQAKHDAKKLDKAIKRMSDERKISNEKTTKKRKGSEE